MRDLKKVIADITDYLSVTDRHLQQDERRDVEKLYQDYILNLFTSISVPVAIVLVIASVPIYFLAPPLHKVGQITTHLIMAVMCALSLTKRSSRTVSVWAIGIQVTGICGYAATSYFVFTAGIPGFIDIFMLSIFYIVMVIFTIILFPQKNAWVIPMTILDIVLGAVAWYPVSAINLPSWTAFITVMAILAMMIFYSQAHRVYRNYLSDLRTARLERKIAERTRELQMIFTHIKQGILTFKPESLVIDKEYSYYLTKLLGTTKIAGETILNLLFERQTIEQEKITLWKNILLSEREKLMQEISLLPREITLKTEQNEEKILEIDWLPICLSPEAAAAGSALEVNKVMVTMRDITQLRRLTQREQSNGRAVQAALLSQQPDAPGVTLATYYNAAEYIGGDWYGTYVDPLNKRFFIFVGDVTGHGTPSALVTSAVSGALSMRFLDIKNQDTDTPRFLSQLASDINKVVLTTGRRAERMMTMAFIGVDQKSGVCHYLNAGHPFILHTTGEKTEAKTSRGDALGYNDNPRFNIISFPLCIGDTIILYTDGLFERYAPQNDYLDLRRLKNLTNGKDPDGIVSAVKQKMEGQWTVQQPRDDCACIAIRFDRFYPAPEIKLVG